MKPAQREAMQKRLVANGVDEAVARKAVAAADRMQAEAKDAFALAMRLAQQHEEARREATHCPVDYKAIRERQARYEACRADVHRLAVVAEDMICTIKDFAGFKAWRRLWFAPIIERGKEMDNARF